VLQQYLDTKISSGGGGDTAADDGIEFSTDAGVDYTADLLPDSKDPGTITKMTEDEIDIDDI
jgi:hypothetical protein